MIAGETLKCHSNDIPLGEVKDNSNDDNSNDDNNAVKDNSNDNKDPGVAPPNTWSKCQSKVFHVSNHHNRNSYYYYCY